MSKPKPLSPQDKFDTIMLLVTETVSAEDYLKHYKIYRAKPKGSIAWGKFTKQIIKQSPALKQGIYPRSFDANSVHYFALRKESDGKFTLANGYSDAGGAGLTYGRPLNAQPDHSHGLCQTFALMYYVNKSDQLIPGDYQKNVLIGLNWLQKYTAQYDWEFDYDNKIEVVQLNEQGLNARPKEKTSLKALLGSWPASKIYKDDDNVDVIRLHDLVVWLLAPQRRPLLNAWAADLQ